MTRRPTDSEWLSRARRSARVRTADRGELVDLALLPPHASLRRYARATFTGGSEIVMLMPPGDAGPDEVGGATADSLRDDPFVVVTRWLNDADVPVPALHAVDEDADALWLEDLGSTDLDTWLGQRPDALEAGYERALDLLVAFQSAVSPEGAPELVTSRRFDADLLRWELEHYVEWRLEAWLGRTPTAAQRAGLDAAFSGLVERLAAIPTHVMHRDFQSHNIMVDGDRLVILDHQDAMVGPLVYDAVALLRDSYVRIPRSVLVRLVRRYAQAVVDSPDLPDASALDVERWFHMQTLQRKLKDAARFVFIDRVKGNPSFLGYIDDSMAYVRDAFSFVGDDAADLAGVLAEIDPEAVP